MQFVSSEYNLRIAMVIVAILALLALGTLWRLAFHVLARSHSRRMLFHVQLLAVVILQIPYWACEISDNGGNQAFGLSFILHIFSESMNFISITLTVFLWANVLSAGLTSSETMRSTIKWKPLHVLIIVNCVQVIYVIAVGIMILEYGGMERDNVYRYVKSNTVFVSLQWIFFFCEIIFTIAVIAVGVQLQCRLIGSGMDEFLKKKSLIQINIAMFTIVLTIFLQMALTLPILWNGMNAWSDLTFTGYQALANSIPCTLNCCCFLYLHRRKEARNLDRIVMPPTPSPHAAECAVAYMEHFPSPCSYPPPPPTENRAASELEISPACSSSHQMDSSHYIIAGVVLPTPSRPTSITIEISGCYGIETYTFALHKG